MIYSINPCSEVYEFRFQNQSIRRKQIMKYKKNKIIFPINILRVVVPSLCVRITIDVIKKSLRGEEHVYH